MLEKIMFRKISFLLFEVVLGGFGFRNGEYFFKGKLFI